MEERFNTGQALLEVLSQLSVDNSGKEYPMAVCIIDGHQHFCPLFEGKIYHHQMYSG